MLKFLKFFLLALFLISLSLATISFVFARELEVTYPAFGGAATPGSTRTLLPDYVRYIFNLVLGISGLVILGVVVYAAFQYLISAGSPTKLSEAKDRILDAIIGLIVLFASYLLLTTINPQLTIINPIIGSNEGVVVYDSVENCELGKGAPQAQESLKPEVNYIKYGVSSASLEGFNGKVKSIWLYKPTSELEVKVYPQQNWEPNNGGTLIERNSEGCVSINDPQAGAAIASAQSIELNWQNPGVYLCKDADGKQCSIYNSSQSKLPVDLDLNGQIRLIKFKNPYTFDSTIANEADCKQKHGQDSTFWPKGTNDQNGKPIESNLCKYDTAKYGSVLHEYQDYKGSCDVYFDSRAFNAPNFLSDTTTLRNDGKPSSMTVFLQSEELSGAVTLFENKNYNQGNEAEITGPPKRAAGEITLSGAVPSQDYPNFANILWRIPGDSSAQININDKVSSLKIEGNYLALMFRDADYKSHCEVLRNNDPNLENNSVTTKTWGGLGALDSVSSLKIIPIRK